jgi:RNA polymerase sigma-70 factor (ECF subfamily)
MPFWASKLAMTGFGTFGTAMREEPAFSIPLRNNYHHFTAIYTGFSDIWTSLGIEVFFRSLSKVKEVKVQLRTLNDEELIDASLAGDGQAFKEIVRRYEPVVVATISAMIGQCVEVDDISQETFIRFYRSLGKFRQDSSVKTYITRIAINRSIEELKRRRRKSLFFLQQHPVEELNVVDEQAGEGYDDSREILMRALSKLDTKARSVIVLRLIDGYSTRETAGILGVPQGTVLSRLARAQEKLEKLLLPYKETTDAKEPKAALSFL